MVGDTDAHRNAQASERYDCDIARCGPSFGGKRCDCDVASWACYCNKANGWCGDTDAHRNAQASERHDCDIARCGPGSGGERCGCDVFGRADDCNEANGRCGDAEAHRDAQASERYDFDILRVAAHPWPVWDDRWGDAGGAGRNPGGSAGLQYRQTKWWTSRTEG